MSYWDGTRWVPEAPTSTPAPRRGRRLFGAVAEASLITLLIFGLIAGSALAAKGGNGNGNGGGKGGGNKGGDGSSTLAVVMVDPSDTTINHGDKVTFAVSTTATDRPFVGLRCYQGSTWIYDAYVGYFDSYLFDQWFVLDSNYWIDGSSADCTARLFYYTKRGAQKVLTTTTFSVAP